MKTVLPDGTVEYSYPGRGVVRYKPVGRYRVRRPADERAVRFGGEWFLPLEVLDEEQRTMPLTRADSDAYDHMTTNLLCKCQVCSRPEAEKGRRRWRRDHGLQA